MWIFYTALVLFILLTGYLFAFPLYKKRPVLIRREGLIMYVFVLSMAIFQFFGAWVITIAMVIILFLYFLKPWFVYGITDTMISAALEKASLITRTPIERLVNRYKIDGSMEVKPFNFAGKINFISFRINDDSKKAKLTKVVFKKFIQNYFI